MKHDEEVKIKTCTNGNCLLCKTWNSIYFVDIAIKIIIKSWKFSVDASVRKNETELILDIVPFLEAEMFLMFLKGARNIRVTKGLNFQERASKDK